ncbi:hypothetical protein FRB99_008190 [Tulasnella sp. 403]|nr:hypothetical protein FRB99_008190 [Tulasnella sp. 403]
MVVSTRRQGDSLSYKPKISSPLSYATVVSAYETDVDNNPPPYILTRSQLRKRQRNAFLPVAVALVVLLMLYRFCLRFAPGSPDGLPNPHSLGTSRTSANADGYNDVFYQDRLDRSRWSVYVSPVFDTLGPFPLQAREQYFFSPSYPISVPCPYVHNTSKTYYSSFPDGGIVSWQRQLSVRPTGSYSVTYPDIRWASIRATQGWSGLQHHSVFRTTITVSPPASDLVPLPPPPPHSLLVSVSRGSLFAIQPRDSELCMTSDSPSWGFGNIYDMPAKPQAFRLPSTLSVNASTSFDLFISADYEIRLFGDPLVMDESDVPVTEVAVRVGLEVRQGVVVGDNHVVPDFLAGWSLGDAVGIELTSLEGQWRIRDVTCIDCPFELSLTDPNFTLVSGQTRRLPLRLVQSARSETLDGVNLVISLIDLDGDGSQLLVNANIPISHIPRLDSLTQAQRAKIPPMLQTQWSPHPSSSFLLPPLDIGSPFKTPILALHGAGVPLSASFWHNAIPRQKHSWVVIVGGGSEWGYDWRGPSLQDAFAALDVLRSREQMWEGAVVIGHSNGGQGAFHLASRFPDFVRSAIPAAAYQSAPLYVPNTWSHGVHFLDPVLEGILKASTAGGDNDLFLGNLVRSRIAVIHGGDDTNVPVYHSRTAVQVVKSWDENADIRLLEVSEKDHWWDQVFSDPKRAGLLAHYVDTKVKDEHVPKSFTLTVLWPHESGPMGGWRILATDVPGRFARLEVENGLTVITSNVRLLSYTNTDAKAFDIEIDGHRISLDGGHATTVFAVDGKGGWQVSRASGEPVVGGPANRVLVSGAPLSIVTNSDPWTLSVAQRLSWALYTQLGLDSNIISDREATSLLRCTDTDKSGCAGNIVVLSGPGPNTYGNAILEGYYSEFSLNTNGSFVFRGQRYQKPGTDNSYELLPANASSGEGTPQQPTPPSWISLSGRPAKRWGAVLFFFVAIGFAWNAGWLEFREDPLHGLPDYRKIWEVERKLPQHNPDLPWPEGVNGRFAKFDIVYHTIGFNNQLQDILMSAQIAYMSNRAYVFQPYLWRPGSPGPVVNESNHWRTVEIPLNAFISGPAAGARYGPGTGVAPSGEIAAWEAPRSISYDFYDQVCPEERRTYVNIKEVRTRLGMEEKDSPPAKEMLEKWSKELMDMNDTCVSITGDHLWTFDAFGPRISSAWPILSDSPLLTQFQWSPLVQGIVARNMHLLTDTSKWKRKVSEPLSGLMALHLRRGDFIEHCRNLCWWSANYNSWNSFPESLDKFPTPSDIPPEEKENTYLKHCLPAVSQIVERVRTVKRQWEAKSTDDKPRRLNKLYFLTNAEKSFRTELRTRLLAEGWDSVSMSQDMLINKAEKEVDMAADMMVAQLAEVFVGNGVGAVLFRLVLETDDGLIPSSQA